jgi:signal transduction histidine kinase
MQRGIRIVVADTGRGIPVAARSKIPEPFVSTKQILIRDWGFG